MTERLRIATLNIWNKAVIRSNNNDVKHLYSSARKSREPEKHAGMSRGSSESACFDRWPLWGNWLG